FVLARVFFIADANESSFQQSNNRGEHLFSWQIGQPDVPSDAPPDLRQNLGKVSKASKFIFIAHLAPSVVITILFAASRVAAGCLDVAVWRRANPDIRPRRWNGQTLDSQEPLFVADALRFRV